MHENQEIPSGFLLIDKPVDWTSHDVVAYLRGVTKIKKIGHAGTLDPFATGLLIVGVGRQATKRLDEFKNLGKTYVAEVQLGATSDTYDKTGTIKKVQSSKFKVQKEKIEETLKSFLGKQQQIPPMYSAKKVQGKKLYELARKGIEIERQPNEIEIFNLELLPPYEGELEGVFRVSVECSTGTYIRTLVHDIGQTLGVGAYCAELRRTAIGDYVVDGAPGPKEVTKENWKTLLKQIEQA